MGNKEVLPYKSFLNEHIRQESNIVTLKGNRASLVLGEGGEAMDQQQTPASVSVNGNRNSDSLR